MTTTLWQDDHIYAAPDCPAIDADSSLRMRSSSSESRSGSSLGGTCHSVRLGDGGHRRLAPVQR